MKSNFEIAKQTLEPEVAMGSINSLFTSVISITSFGVILTNLNGLMFCIMFAVILLSVFLNSKCKQIIFKYNEENIPYNRFMGYIYHIATSPQYSKEIRMYNIQQWLHRKYSLTFSKLKSRFLSNQKKLLPYQFSVGILFRLQDLILYLYLSSQTLLQKNHIR